MSNSIKVIRRSLVAVSVAAATIAPFLGRAASAVDSHWVAGQVAQLCSAEFSGLTTDESMHTGAHAPNPMNLMMQIDREVRQTQWLSTEKAASAYHEVLQRECSPKQRQLHADLLEERFAQWREDPPLLRQVLELQRRHSSE